MQYKDLLQLMIEATVEGDSSNKSRKLSNEEITSHAINFMLAGYETTANALSYISYLLALNPHVQEKLQEDIDKYYEKNQVRTQAYSA
jgi:cytochrome P450 family 3 subfamily A